MEFAFRQRGRLGLNRFEVKTRAGDVWFVVPVQTEYGSSLQRKLLEPLDAIALGQALVSEGAAALAGQEESA